MKQNLNKQVEKQGITPKNYNEAVKNYQGLVWMITKQFIGKSQIPAEDLMGSAWEGLFWAVDDYNEKSKLTFKQFAGFRIKYAILAAIENEGRLVRLPKSAQQRERAKLGYNMKYDHVSGENPIKGSGTSVKNTYFDMVPGNDNVSDSIENTDMTNLMRRIWLNVEKKFGSRDTEIFKMFYGFETGEKLKAAEIAEAVGCTKVQVSQAVKRIKDYMKTNTAMRRALSELRDIINVGKHSQSLNDVTLTVAG